MTAHDNLGRAIDHFLMMKPWIEPFFHCLSCAVAHLSSRGKAVFRTEIGLLGLLLLCIGIVNLMPLS